MWGKKKQEPARPDVVDDIAEARAMREEAEAELIELKRQAPLVRSLTQSLNRRGLRNHFGDSIEITFVRKHV